MDLHRMRFRNDEFYILHIILGNIWDHSPSCFFTSIELIYKSTDLEYLASVNSHRTPLLTGESSLFSTAMLIYQGARGFINPVTNINHNYVVIIARNNQVLEFPGGWHNTRRLETSSAKHLGGLIAATNPKSNGPRACLARIVMGLSMLLEIDWENHN